MMLWNYPAGEWLRTAAADSFHIEFQNFMVEETLNLTFETEKFIPGHNILQVCAMQL
jgi:hypothetical protein